MPCILSTAWLHLPAHSTAAAKPICTIVCTRYNGTQYSCYAGQVRQTLLRNVLGMLCVHNPTQRLCRTDDGETVVLHRFCLRTHFSSLILFFCSLSSFKTILASIYLPCHSNNYRYTYVFYSSYIFVIVDTDLPFSTTPFESLRLVLVFPCDLDKYVNCKRTKPENIQHCCRFVSKSMAK